MSVVKAEEYAQLITIFSTRHEAGIQALRAWLYNRRDRINSEWPGVEGEQLVRLQGAAQEIARLIKIIDVGPVVKPNEETRHGN